MSLPTLTAWSCALFLSASLVTHTVALRLLLLLFAGAFAIGALARNRQALEPLPPIWLAWALWAAWVALSLAWSHEPARSLKEFRNEVGYAALALWVCFIGAQARDAARIIMPAVAAAALFVCVVSIWHFFDDPGAYADGLHGGSGNLSSALLTLMPCVLLAAWLAGRRGQRRTRLALLALAAIVVIAAHTTLNRTVWVGFAAQLLVIGALLVARDRRMLDFRTKVFAAVAALAIIAGGTGMVLQVQADRESAGLARPFSEDPRWLLWSKSIEQIREQPLAGYGFGRGVTRGALREELKDPLLWHSHNLLLDIWIQVGLPGLILLLLLLGATVREGWRLSQGANDVARVCGIALIAVVAGMLIRNMTDMLLLRQNALFFWGVVGVLLAMGRSARERPAE